MHRLRHVKIPDQANPWWFWHACGVLKQIVSDLSKYGSCILFFIQWGHTIQLRERRTFTMTVYGGIVMRILLMLTDFFRNFLGHQMIAINMIIYITYIRRFKFVETEMYSERQHHSNETLIRLLKCKWSKVPNG